MTNKFKMMLLASVVVSAVAGVWGLSTKSFAHGDDHDHAAEAIPAQNSEDHAHDDEHEEGEVKLTPAQISAAAIEVLPVTLGRLGGEVKVPGRIVATADRYAQVTPKISGSVVEAVKNLGDTVKKGDVLARIESREMAEAVADNLAANRSAALALANFKREKRLWEQKITAEQDYLTAKNDHEAAQIQLELTRQKLQALGYEGDAKKASSRFYALRAPIDGRVITREITLGEYVDTTHIAFAIADTSVVWFESAIAPADLGSLREGQEVTVASNVTATPAKLIFLSPAIDPTTRTAKAIIEIDNKDSKWRIGELANGFIEAGDAVEGLIIPKTALQNIEGKPVVFVQIDGGFEKREVTLGRTTSQMAEIVAGLHEGDAIAVSNVFTLKAELGKSEASHEH